LVDYRQGGDIVSFTAGFAKSRGTLKETAIDREKPRIVPGVILDAATNKYIQNTIQIPTQVYWQNFGLAKHEPECFYGRHIRYPVFVK
jgi:hypothetical protein